MILNMMTALPSRESATMRTSTPTRAAGAIRADRAVATRGRPMTATAIIATDLSAVPTAATCRISTVTAIMTTAADDRRRAAHSDSGSLFANAASRACSAVR